MIIYTNFLAGKVASTRAFVTFIRPEFRDDKGVAAHEAVHVRQWLALPVIHSVLYLLSKRYRLWAEVQAYRAQMAFGPESDGPRFAECIAKDYGLSITPEKALVLLKGVSNA